MLRLKVSWSIWLSSFSFRQDLVGQFLAELDAELVEAVDVPYHALREYLVLVQGNQASEVARGQLSKKEDARGRLPGYCR